MAYLEKLQQIQKALGELGALLPSIPPLQLEEMEVLYAAAFGLYEVGDYLKAADLFTRLILYDPFQLRFWKGLASSRQMSKEFQAALHAWAIVCLLETKNSLFHFHAAECLLSLGDPKEALKALNISLAHCEETDPLFQKMQTLKKQVHLYGN